MSLSLYVYSNTIHRNSSNLYQYDIKYLGGKKVFTHLIFRTPADDRVLRSAFNKKRNGLYLLKNCKINFECKDADFLIFVKYYNCLVNNQMNDIYKEWYEERLLDYGDDIKNLLVEIG